ncbi:RING finger protein 17 isoform X2 [Ceratina calcarata]|nr:RING finger protein 17 isoform X2 [Ceratina calcarata]XP_026668020.1 RING finger protein 17 isoform X2 [Ceratina calcarata]XP_026668021.1 RING finger protein 17 isoform X2 [Ceratina calcarata]XP_026668022.1 RING finger protein 17 isoform X2 [Ceratina calcarata]XP_026668023.1 RING finger protein 17 isoform X2 [Ceratina calcarata]XP_026668024.1 RING finger protein 17 isoform X2 [Ceratina calcarata]XP_026668025.1 RING finger protein 17 isoform X2 [Ceratina calcarata]XP_026668026.1 RING finge
MVSTSAENQTSSLPLNIYALGLMIMSHNRPIDVDDCDISFSKPYSSKAKQQSFIGLCHECGIHATIKCLQCAALYCHICYAKIHRRALQNHTKVILGSNKENVFIIKNTCLDTCSEPLGYYCESCDVAGCSHCMLRMHSQHKSQPLKQKNEERMEEFSEVFYRVSESYYRIQQSRKKLTVLSSQPSEMQDIVENIESKVTQHFSYLHGVLQNLESEIINSIRKYEDIRKKNIDEISLELKQHEDRLQSALMAEAHIKNSLDKVDIKQIIEQFETLSKTPCHLVLNSAPDDSFEFEYDSNIVEILEKHCAIHVPEASSYTLKQTDSLPEDYNLEPYIPKLDISVSRQSEKSVASTRSTGISHSPTIGSSETVRVSHVVDPSHFYVQLAQNQKKIMGITKGLEVLVNTAATTPTEITINELYIVQHSENSDWYRARIIDKKTQANGEERYTATFIDYGTREENVSLKNIRNISPELASTPMMAFKCSLHDIVPNNGKWHPEAITTFKDLVFSNMMVSMRVIHNTGDTYYVDLCVVSAKDSNLTYVKDSLIYMKYATCVTPNKLMRMNPGLTKKYYKEQLDMDAFTKVNLLSIDSPNAIFVEKADANRAYLCNLIQELTNDCDQDEYCNFTSMPSKGMPCAARRSDKYWYRGLIQEVTENAATVFFVDLGHTLHMEYSEIKPLHTKYMSCTTQAIKVMLRNIKPKSENDEWGEESKEFLRTVLNKTKRIRVIPHEKFGDAYSVTMLINEKTNVAQLLLKYNLAISYNSSARNNRNKRNKKHDKSLINTMGKCLELQDNDQSFNAKSVKSSVRNSENNEDPFKINVDIHQVQSPDCIYVSETTCDRKDVESMMRSMQEFYAKYHSAKHNWNKDSVCTVYLEKSEMYYRARIVDIKSDDKVTVFLYDIGIEETVPMDKIQSLYPRYANTPTHIFKIKLTGILPCGGSNTWPTFSCQKLSEIINNNHNCKFYISKVDEEDMENGAIPVELWIKQLVIDGPLSPSRYEINSINRLLVENGVALPIKEYAKKRDKILAIELKRELSKKIELLSKSESDENWISLDGVIQALSSLDEFVKKSLSTSSDMNSHAETNDDEQDFTDLLDNLPSLPRLSSWLPAEPIEADVFIAIPTYIDDDGFVYLHSINQNSRSLKHIEEQLENLYERPPIESCDSLWNVGDLCIAQYHTDNKWYRGKIIEILNDDVVKVEFVDYGNVEECSIGTLKKKVILENIPIQCTKCTVYGLYPENEKWLTSDLDRIHNIIIEQKCEVTVIDRTEKHLVISIDILPNKYCKKKTDLIAYLTHNCKMNIKPIENTLMEQRIAAESEFMEDTITEFMGNITPSSDEEEIEPIICNNPAANSFADTIEKSDSSTTIENFPLVTSTPYTGSQEILSDKYKPLNIPKDVVYIEIEMCCNLTATEFFAHLRENVHSTVLNSYYTQYKFLMTELQEKASKQPMITTFSPNTPCCAKFSVDDRWYRCIISESKLDLDSGYIVINLLYIDYGNNEYRQINPQECELYALKKEWLNVPPMSMKCKLWNIEIAPTIEQNNPVLIAELEKCYNRPIIAVIKELNERFKSVELYEDKKCEKLLLKKLIEKGLLVRINEDE